MSLSELWPCLSEGGGNKVLSTTGSRIAGQSCVVASLTGTAFSRMLHWEGSRVQFASPTAEKSGLFCVIEVALHLFESQVIGEKIR